MSHQEVDASPSGEDGSMEVTRRVKVHKIRAKPQAQSPLNRQRLDAALDKRISEIIPGLADLSLSDQTMAGARDTAREIRMERLQKEQQHAEELKELHDIYDMSKPNPVDKEMPEGPWSQQIRPKPRRIVLSPYQYEMINYQRMLMRKNIWYYRDRMSVPRGPCPLHVLKDCWVQGTIDEHTLVWGQGLYDWLPAKNVKLLVAMVRTPEGEAQSLISNWMLSLHDNRGSDMLDCRL